MDPQAQFTTRPRSKSSFSLKSNKSDKKPKLDLTETPAEKKRSRFSVKTKVNPNRALNEAQPGAFLQEPSTLTSLRSFQYRDPQGNLIQDPDSTNPTRPRMERPLDTIRSFEAAIDNGYRRRSHMMRAESSPALDGMTSLPGTPNMNGRRSMQYGNEQSFNPRSFSQPGYSRHQSLRGNYNYDGYGTPPPPSGQRRPMAPRTGPPPMQYGPNGDYTMYPIHQYQDSHDTVNTGESSGTEWANSTDPSSENSSIDRVAMKQTDPERVSPIHGAIMEENLHDGRPYPSEERYSGPAHRVPMHSNGMAFNGMPMQPQQPPAPRQIIRLGGESSAVPVAPKGPIYPGARPAVQRQDSEKKKGWLKKRFSKGA